MNSLENVVYLLIYQKNLSKSLIMIQKSPSLKEIRRKTDFYYKSVFLKIGCDHLNFIYLTKKL
ncbi:hypothetical protein CY0110_18182 [Crocosphaera chwakensis CCY0110]|uniref:Uncharacterized protein n=1 Tax=Crocosphaera chwakensis CCY0110 TaxID=391612 RepID=A3IIW8_9CHRO|nr:hypothetical protein CY0110_18182 [Crocosphaera chwakensis CCY0110]